MTIDPASVAAIIKTCARRITLPAFRNLQTVDIAKKGPNDYVTVADVDTEGFLKPRLLDLLPGSVVVAEETAGPEPDWRNTLETAGAVWLIDPIDGTANFAAGISLFGIMVALVEKGTVTHGWIYDPILDDMAVAVLGGGAWMGGRRLSVSSARELSDMRGTLSIPFATDADARLLLEASRYLAPSLEVRSAAQTYLYLVSGRLDYALFHNIFPWDHAAGILIHSEAGGFARHRDGAAFLPYGPVRGNSVVAAPDQNRWRQLVDHLKGSG